jgi:hypothetical protein
MFKKRMILSICLTIVVMLAITVSSQLPYSAQAQAGTQ